MEGKTKEKLLYILERLRKTDEQHPVNTNELIDYLGKRGVSAERKSVARDIAALREAGYSVILCDELKKGYYMTDQLFEDYELKIIADAVSGAKSITYDDSKALIEKLCELSSPTGEEIIREQTFIDEKIKSGNKKVRYTIDKVMTAIKNKKRITFQYYEFASDGKRKLKRDGHIYEISPYYVCWADDSYFLIGNSKSHDHLTHFHIDMMTNVEITRMPIRQREEIEELRGSFSIGEYLRRSVNMYGGESIDLVLECSGKVAKDLRKEFGENIITVPLGDEKFRTELKAAEGEGLIRWLMQFSPEDIKVIAPECIRTAMKERAASIAESY